MPRRLLCECGACRRCKHREYMRRYYQRPEVAAKTRVRSRAYRDANLEVVQQRDRQRTRGGKKTRRNGSQPTEASRAQKRRWKRLNPEKVRAQSLVAYYIRTGRLKRQPCEVCGEAKTHAHHDDYNHKLDVRWLCPKHHGQAHWTAA